jgi:neutral amino acid transport system permease protein
MELLQLTINGIVVGSIIALAAVGLTLSFGILRLPNFAHGEFLTLGAYFTYIFAGIPFVAELKNSNNIRLTLLTIGVCILLAAVATIGVTLLCEGLIWSTMRKRRTTSTTLMIISIGLSLFLRNLITFIWGGDNQSYGLAMMPAINLFGLQIVYFDIIVVLLAALVILGLHLVLQNTKIGKAMRAVADDLDLARVSGINVEQVVVWTWVLAGGFTAIGGGMYGLITAVRPNMGWFMILPIFASVILGGIGNPYGAIAGALIIGITQEVSTYWISPAYKLAVALIMMVLVLLVAPKGLFRSTI